MYTQLSLDYFDTEENLQNMWWMFMMRMTVMFSYDSKEFLCLKTALDNWVKLNLLKVCIVVFLCSNCAMKLVGEVLSSNRCDGKNCDNNTQIVKKNNRNFPLS